jgi:hypothetical protein
MMSVVRVVRLDVLFQRLDQPVTAGRFDPFLLLLGIEPQIFVHAFEQSLHHTLCPLALVLYTGDQRRDIARNVVGKRQQLLFISGAHAIQLYGSSSGLGISGRASSSLSMR